MFEYDAATDAEITALTNAVIDRTEKADDKWTMADAQEYAYYDLMDAYTSRVHKELTENTPEAGSLDEYDPEYHALLTRNLPGTNPIHPNG